MKETLMSRRPIETAHSFSRNDIFAIRDFWDSKMEEGWFPYQIARALVDGRNAPFPWASHQTIIRIGRRETWKEVGVGPTERPNISNRLRGEARQIGHPAAQQFHPVPPIEGLSTEALERRAGEVPPAAIKADGTLHIHVPGEEGFELPEEPSLDAIEEILARRGKEKQ